MIITHKFYFFLKKGVIIKGSSSWKSEQCLRLLCASTMLRTRKGFLSLYSKSKLVNYNCYSQKNVNNPLTHNDHHRYVHSSAADLSGSATKAREVVSLTRHYATCYWELSKARLRFPIPIPYPLSIILPISITLLLLFNNSFIRANTTFIVDCRALELDDVLFTI